MPTTLYTVDSFTNVSFAGNPAAVCVLDSPRDEGWMQSVAAAPPCRATVSCCAGWW